MAETQAYTQAVAMTRALVDQGALRFRVAAPYGRQFVQARMEGDDFSSILEPLGRTGRRLNDEDLDQIERLLTALAADAGAESFEALISREHGREAAADARTAYGLAEERLADVVLKLREKAWIKRTSKNGLLGTLEWEFALKLTDDDFQSPVERPLPYAILRFEASSPKLRPLSEPTEALVMSVDQEDVEMMLEILGRLDQVFRASEDD